MVQSRDEEKEQWAPSGMEFGSPQRGSNVQYLDARMIRLVRDSAARPGCAKYADTYTQHSTVAIINTLPAKFISHSLFDPHRCWRYGRARPTNDKHMIAT
jgi:hypothetical protein